MTFIFELFVWCLLGGAVLGVIYLRTNLIEKVRKDLALETSYDTAGAVAIAGIFWPTTLMAAVFYMGFLRLRLLKAKLKEESKN